MCVPCKPGEYVNVTGATACDTCTAGTFSNVTKAKVCHQCAVGSVSARNASTCTPCALLEQANNGRSACEPSPSAVAGVAVAGGASMTALIVLVALCAWWKRRSNRNVHRQRVKDAVTRGGGDSAHGLAAQAKRAQQPAIGPVQSLPSTPVSAAHSPDVGQVGRVIVALHAARRHIGQIPRLPPIDSRRGLGKDTNSASLSDVANKDEGDDGLATMSASSALPSPDVSMSQVTLSPASQSTSSLAYRQLASPSQPLRSQHAAAVAASSLNDGDASVDRTAPVGTSDAGLNVDSSEREAASLSDALTSLRLATTSAARVAAADRLSAALRALALPEDNLSLQDHLSAPLAREACAGLCKPARDDTERRACLDALAQLCSVAIAVGRTATTSQENAWASALLRSQSDACAYLGNCLRVSRSADVWSAAANITRQLARSGHLREQLGKAGVVGALASARRTLIEQGHRDGAPAELMHAALAALRFAGPRTSEFEVVSELGAGGFGSVLRVRRTALAGSEYAIKVVRIDSASSATVADGGRRTPDAATRRISQARARQRALDEFRYSESLVHAHIVRTHDVWVDDKEACVYLLLELCGEDLSSVLARDGARTMTADGGKRLFELAAPLVDALCYLSKQGKVHLDIKPRNILVDARGAPKLADFGMARPVREASTAEEEQARADASLPPLEVGQAWSSVGGTREYMSPEQARAFLAAQQAPGLDGGAGGEARSVDGRSDVFSLGLVLHEAAYGCPPYGNARGSEALGRLARGQLSIGTNESGAQAADVPADVRDLLERMLEVDVDRRPSAAALREWMRARNMWRVPAGESTEVQQEAAEGR